MSFQKACRFSNIMILPRSGLSHFVKSIPELPGIYTRKWITNNEITLAALILKPTVLRLELGTLRDLCHWKIDFASFMRYQICLNLTSGARSTRSGKNDENKPKCWKFAHNGYPAYHPCVQNLPNPHHAFLKSKYLFEEGKFFYNVVFPICREHLQADLNPHRKIGKKSF